MRKTCLTFAVVTLLCASVVLVYNQQESLSAQGIKQETESVDKPIKADEEKSAAKQQVIKDLTKEASDEEKLLRLKIHQAIRSGEYDKVRQLNAQLKILLESVQAEEQGLKAPAQSGEELKEDLEKKDVPKSIQPETKPLLPESKTSPEKAKK